jgi:hypothetical protein
MSAADQLPSDRPNRPIPGDPNAANRLRQQRAAELARSNGDSGESFFQRIDRISQGLSVATRELADPSDSPEPEVQSPEAATDSEVQESTKRRMAESTQSLPIFEPEEAISVPLFELEELAVADKIDGSDVYPTELAERAIEWLQKVYGETWWRVLGFEYKSDINVNELADELVSRIHVRRPNTPTRVSFILGAWLKGENMSILAESVEGLGSVGAVSQIAISVRKQLQRAPGSSVIFPEQHSKIEAPPIDAEPEQSKDSAWVQPTLPPIASQETVVIKQGSEQEPEPEPAPAPKRAPISQQWATRLQLKEKDAVELRHYLNPTGSVGMNHNGYQPFKKLKSYIAEHFETFDDESLQALSDDQKNMLREILGFDRKGDTNRPGMQTHQTVARFIRDHPERMYGYRKPQELVNEIVSAFQVLLDASALQEAK